MSDETSRPGRAWIPNALTSIRILSIPLIIAMILGVSTNASGFLGHWPWLIALFLFACLTDFLDGHLARKWNATSDFGRMIDPIADKLLVAGCLIAFCIASSGLWVILVPALAIIGRDILVSGAREHAALSGRVMPPTNLAKWKTAFEMFAIVLLIVWIIFLSEVSADSEVFSLLEFTQYAGLACLWFAAILSVYTGSVYIKAAVKD